MVETRNFWKKRRLLLVESLRQRFYIVNTRGYARYLVLLTHAVFLCAVSLLWSADSFLGPKTLFVVRRLFFVNLILDGQRASGLDSSTSPSMANMCPTGLILLIASSSSSTDSLRGSSSSNITVNCLIIYCMVNSHLNNHTPPSLLYTFVTLP